MRYREALAIALVVCWPGTTQTKQKKSRKVSSPSPLIEQAPKPAENLPVFQEGSFDVASYSEGLPPRFMGVGSLELINALADRHGSSKKDEYETTTQFEARLKELKAKPMLRNIRATDMLALLIQEPSFKRAYDADQGVLKVQLVQHPYLGTSLEPSDFKLTKRMLAIELGRETRSEDAVFTNAYGASWKGRDVNEKQGIAILPPHAPTTFQIPLEPIKAKELRDKKLGVLLVGRLKSTNLVTSGTSSKATINSPTDLFILMNSCTYTPQQVWVYVLETGQVLQRVEVVAPPLSKVGIDLGREDLFTEKLSILAPAAFTYSTNAAGTQLHTTYSAVSPDFPQVRITWVSSKQFGKSDPKWNLDGYYSTFTKAFEKASDGKFTDVKFGELEIAGCPAKTMRANLQVGILSYVSCSAVFLRQDSVREEERIAVHVWVDATIDQAEAEANRILQSIAVAH